MLGVKISKSNNLKKDNSLEENVIESDVEPSNIDYDNLENATLIEGVKVNTSEKIKQVHKVIYDMDESLTKLVMTDATIVSATEKDGAYFRAKITNTGTDDFPESRITIMFFKKKGLYLSSVDYVIEQDIKSNETIEIELFEIDDFINSYDYEVRVLG